MILYYPSLRNKTNILLHKFCLQNLYKIDWQIEWQIHPWKIPHVIHSTIPRSKGFIFSNSEKHEFLQLTVQYNAKKIFLITAIIHSSVCLPNYNPIAVEGCWQRYEGAHELFSSWKFAKNWLDTLRWFVNSSTRNLAKREANVEIIAHICRWYAVIRTLNLAA